MLSLKAIRQLAATPQPMPVLDNSFPEEIHLDPLDEEEAPIAVATDPPTAECLLRVYMEGKNKRGVVDEAFINLWIEEMEELLSQAGVSNEEFKAMIYAGECDTKANNYRA